MKYQITFSPEALDDYRSLSAYDRAAVKDAINIHLLHQPARTSRSRIKRLRDLRKPQYRLRIGDLRIFYDVIGSTVEILAVVDKRKAADWLRKCGEQS